MKTESTQKQVLEMATKRKSKYLTKTTFFNGEKLTLYSLDGEIWSTRKKELAAIKYRLENETISLDSKKSSNNEEEKKEEEENEEELDQELDQDLDEENEAAPPE